MAALLDLPGPDLPAEEQARRWIETPIEFWEACRRDYGDMVSLNLGSLGQIILVSDPAMVKDIFQLAPDTFTIEEYNEHYRFVMGGRSLLLSDGDTHQRRRRLMMPPFKRDQLLAAFPTMRSIATNIVEAWPEDRAFNPRPTFHHFTVQVILHRLFGDTSHPTARALLEAYRERVLSQVGSWGPWQGFRKMQPLIRDALTPEIAARRADPDLPGILSHIANGTREDGSPVEAAEIEDHVFTLLIAGVDTTAISLTWCLYWLSSHPASAQALAQELDTAGPEVDIVDLLRLPYLDAVFSETRRMFPVVTTPSGRRLVRPARVAGRDFPAGVTLLPCTYLVHRREDVYPESSRFRPERFLEKRYPSHEFFPSGGGNRTCLGMILSMFEFKVMLAEIMRRRTLQSQKFGPVTPVRHGTFLAPPQDFTVSAHRRTA